MQIQASHGRQTKQAEPAEKLRDASTAAPRDNQKLSVARQGPLDSVARMQKRRVIQRQGVVLRLDQHLDFGTAEDVSLSHARGEPIHDFKIAFA